MQAIADGTWEPLYKPLELANAMVPPKIYCDQKNAFRQSLHFDFKLLPKFKHTDDVEDWILNINQFCNTHGEQLICPQLAWNCFREADPIKLWYSMLGGRNHVWMTKEDGYWFNFHEKMREAWAKSIAVSQRETEDHQKLPNEIFLVYYFQKLAMLMQVFPESYEATHISRIRAKFNDTQANRYIHEKYNFKTFASEIRQYDDYLKLYPFLTKPSIRMPQNSYSSFLQ